ncbi:hypothetical protein [Helicobacter anatolicus]|uniref:hypothetical protein n=1 Tax=Helicobacter anatolicus TaxID=2905874 RepID=UPI001E3208A7|nr:hypothetical protein [Helicobacter anatolicus]MCE3038584.1 hypothetical protein [Helicobacter anatolicus]
MKKILFFIMTILFAFCEKIDYMNLDLKYYPYIMFYEKFSDEEIAQLIEDVDRGEKKTGVFLGVITGGFDGDLGGSAYKQYFSYGSNQSSSPSFSYGIKLGYQSFLPSFLERLSYPGMLGTRAYVQYLSMLPTTTLFGKERMSSIMLAWDLLLDIPVVKNFDAGVIFGVAAGNMVYQNNADSSFSFMANFGIGVSLFGHNRIDFELKIFTNSMLDWFGAFYGVGYNYVF